MSAAQWRFKSVSKILREPALDAGGNGEVDQWREVMA